jgi:hypothetical protein
MRIAVLLFVACAALSGMLTPTFAKYMAQGNANAKARVAIFKIEKADKAYVSNAWGTTDTTIQLAKLSSTATDYNFDLPLFDYEYAAEHRNSTAPRNASTVTSNTAATVAASQKNLVIAPGIGHFGAQKSNPNLQNNSTANSMVRFIIRNTSEVLIRFKIEYDYNNSVLPGLDASGNIASYTGLNTANVTRLPIFIRCMNGNGTSWFRTDNNSGVTSGLRNLFLSAAGVTAMNTGNDSLLTTVALSKNYSADGWYYLNPGEETGTNNANVGITWTWLFGLNSTTATGYGPNNTNWNYAGWGDGAVKDTAGNDIAAFAGFSSTTVLPYLSTTREDNIDRFDTLLGKAAANGTTSVNTYNATLRFKFTIQQVD